MAKTQQKGWKTDKTESAGVQATKMDQEEVKNLFEKAIKAPKGGKV